MYAHAPPPQLIRHPRACVRSSFVYVGHMAQGATRRGRGGVYVHMMGRLRCIELMENVECGLCRSK